MTDYMGSRLPAELINLIYSFLSAHDMTCMARASRRLNEITVPFLYRNIVLTRRNASALFYGLPRQPATKKRYLNKAAWNAAHDKFKAEFASVIGRIPDDGAGNWSWTTPAPYDMEGSDPETDDEEPDPPQSDSGDKEKAPVPPHDTGDLVAWCRKKALLSYCHSLAIVQAPPTGLCRDLLMDISDVVIDNSVPQSVPTVRQLGMSRYMKRNESRTKYRAHTTLFSNLAHLSIGSRAVHSLSERDDIARLERHPFFSLLPLLGKPVRACVACPPAEGPPAYNSEYIFRRLRNERETTSVRSALPYGMLSTTDLRSARSEHAES